MSIFRCINGKNNDRDFLEKKKNYITDSVKTDDGKLVGSNACFCEHGLNDWYSVKKIYHKSGGKQGEHFALSLTPNKKLTPNSKYMELAENVANIIFDKFNCIYSVHIDSKYRHVHFLINSVSFTDGKRYHSSKSDLADIKSRINHILEKFGFDIIYSSSDKIIDDTPYDLENGFEPLEINDDEPYTESYENVIADPDSDEFFDDKEMYIHVTKPCKTNVNTCEYTENNNYNFESEDYYMSNTFNCLPDTAVHYQPQLPADTNYNMNNPLAQMQPQSYSTALPTMILNFSPKITINATPDTTGQDIKNYLNAATPKINSTSCLKCTGDMASELDRRNIRMNIEANIFPDITINIVEPDNSNNSPSDENVIDVEAKEVW